MLLFALAVIDAFTVLFHIQYTMHILLLLALAVVGAYIVLLLDALAVVGVYTRLLQ